MNEVAGRTHPSRGHFSTGSARSSTGLARWAVRLAAAAPVAIGTALVLFGAADAIGGPDATSDNWVGVLVGVGLLAGLLAAVVGFALGVVATPKHEPRWGLWLPLSVFPAVLAFFVLGEAFWWE